jgi:hypothetical protein
MHDTPHAKHDGAGIVPDGRMASGRSRAQVEVMGTGTGTASVPYVSWPKRAEAALNVNEYWTPHLSLMRLVRLITPSASAAYRRGRRAHCTAGQLLSEGTAVALRISIRLDPSGLFPVSAAS